MRDDLMGLPWIKDVTVRRQLPDHLSIRLLEQYPIALWQKKKTLSLIDDAGHVIEEKGMEDAFSGLLVVTGEEAPQATPMLLEALRAYPHIKQRVTGAMYVSKRRWDLLIDNKLRLKLPETHLEEGLAFFEKLDQGQEMDPKEIVFIDVRNPEKAYIRYRTPPSHPVQSKKKSKDI
jgi:cell division protein FtsQ